MNAQETQLISVDAVHPEAAIIARAAELLRSGALVAFPTETVYGLGANALDAQALERIFIAKQRPHSDPIIAHIAQASQLDELAVDVPVVARDLAAMFWPGPLTLILRRAPAVPEIIARGRDTIAVRMPEHPVARALLQAAEIPIGAPSANRFTRPSATTAAHVLEDLGGRIAMILDAGPATIGLESTVLDLTGSAPQVLRPGGVTLETLRRQLPDIELAPRYVSEAQGSQAPGQMLKHYSPRAEVLLFRGDNDAQVLSGMRARLAEQMQSGHRTAVLVSDEDAAGFDGASEIYRLGPAQDLNTIGQRLFAAFRELDERGVQVILVRDPGRAGLGAALWDRLLRAAEGRVIDV